MPEISSGLSLRVISRDVTERCNARPAGRRVCDGGRGSGEHGLRSGLHRASFANLRLEVAVEPSPCAHCVSGERPAKNPIQAVVAASFGVFVVLSVGGRFAPALWVRRCSRRLNGTDGRKRASSQHSSAEFAKSGPFAAVKAPRTGLCRGQDGQSGAAPPLGGSATHTDSGTPIFG